jgi:hypothetical protein
MEFFPHLDLESDVVDSSPSSNQGKNHESASDEILWKQVVF